MLTHVDGLPRHSQLEFIRELVPIDIKAFHVIMKLGLKTEPNPTEVDAEDRMFVVLMVMPELLGDMVDFFAER